MKRWVYVLLIILAVPVGSLTGCVSDGWSPFNDPDSQRQRSDKAFEELKRETQ